MLWQGQTDESILLNDDVQELLVQTYIGHSNRFLALQQLAKFRGYYDKGVRLNYDGSLNLTLLGSLNEDTRLEVPNKSGDFSDSNPQNWLDQFPGCIGGYGQTVKIPKDVINVISVSAVAVNVVPGVGQLLSAILGAVAGLVSIFGKKVRNGFNCNGFALMRENMQHFRHFTLMFKGRGFRDFDKASNMSKQINDYTKIQPIVRSWRDWLILMALLYPQYFDDREDPNDENLRAWLNAYGVDVDTDGTVKPNSDDDNNDKKSKQNSFFIILAFLGLFLIFKRKK